jgi:D-arabinose 1-dehydrogenase-like Zn-dependent alcohol dehydrogenase
MKALVLKEFGGPLSLEDIPVPQPAADEALIRVKACAVDQFDITIRDGKFAMANKVPIILGHEIAGVVEAVGTNVKTVGTGDRVTSTLYMTCGQCRYCMTGRETICADFKGYIGIHTPGAYAEYTTVPAINLVKMPETITFPDGSVLANAIGTPYHALTKRARLQPGERIIVTGAGGVGAHAIQLARMMGAFVMAVDIGEKKLSLVRDLGADAVFDASDGDFSPVAREWANGEGVDVVLELVGTTTFESSMKSLARGGRMVIVGSHTGTTLAASPQAIIANEWEILGSRNVSKRELVEVINLVAAGRIRPIVTGTYPLEEAEAIHQRLRKQEILGRVVLEP